MPIIGMNYRKVKAERGESLPQQVNINTSPRITDVKKDQIKGVGAAPIDILNVAFTFTSTIEPKAGTIEIDGNIFYRPAEKGKDKEILDSWKKKKAVPPEVNIEIINHIFRKTAVLALNISDALGLPPVVGLPRIVKQAEPERKELG